MQSNLGCDRTDFVMDSSIPSKAALHMSPELTHERLTHERFSQVPGVVPWFLVHASFSSSLSPVLGFRV